RRFEQTVDNALVGALSTYVARSQGRTRSFPIGTTAVIYEGAQKHYLVALTKTDPQTSLANAGIEELWKALGDLWNKVRETAGGDPVAIPLLGSGLARIGIEPIH